MEENSTEKKPTLASLRAELETVKAERDSLKEELEAARAVPPDAAETVEKFLKERIPVLFDYDQFPVNKKQNMVMHREFVRESLAKLLDELRELGDSNAG